MKLQKQTGTLPCMLRMLKCGLCVVLCSILLTLRYVVVYSNTDKNK